MTIISYNKKTCDLITELTDELKFNNLEIISSSYSKLNMDITRQKIEKCDYYSCFTN